MFSCFTNITTITIIVILSTILMSTVGLGQDISRDRERYMDAFQENVKNEGGMQKFKDWQEHPGTLASFLEPAVKSYIENTFPSHTEHDVDIALDKAVKAYGLYVDFVVPSVGVANIREKDLDLLVELADSRLQTPWLRMHYNLLLFFETDDVSYLANALRCRPKTFAHILKLFTKQDLRRLVASIGSRVIEENYANAQHQWRPGSLMTWTASLSLIYDTLIVDLVQRNFDRNNIIWFAELARYEVKSVPGNDSFDVTSAYATMKSEEISSYEFVAGILLTGRVDLIEELKKVNPRGGEDLAVARQIALEVLRDRHGGLGIVHDNEN